tara:strand:+ start:197 stop:469 length:273 start_codon:yes stop_codon:yes gene_type:complete
MRPLDDLYKFVFNTFYESDTKDESDLISNKMKSEGYSYDRDNEWWVRIWTTNRGRDKIKEIYQQLESGKWNKIMIGYGDNVFYQQMIDTL